jgi:LysR family transcriptional regulator, transcriptional activator for dmlA
MTLGLIWQNKGLILRFMWVMILTPSISLNYWHRIAEFYVRPPSYIAQYASPNSINELASHHCLVIQERNQAIGNWLLTNGSEQINVPVSYQYTTNSGNIALDWALQGKGVLLRSQWHVQPYLASEQLVQLLPEWYQPADIWAVFTQRPSNSAKLNLLVNFLADYLEKNLNKLS